MLKIETSGGYMNSVKIIHAGDLHYCPEKKEEFLKSARKLIEVGREIKVDLYVFPGDFFDKSIKNTDYAGLPEVKAIMLKLLDIAPIVVIYGTITHDIPGCYDIFCNLNAVHGFTIIQPGQDYYLTSAIPYYSGNNLAMSAPFISTGKRSNSDRLLILGLPEPQKNWFLKDKSLSKIDGDEAIKNGLKDLLLGYGAIRKENKDLPCLFMYHGNVTGSVLCNGQQLKPGAIEIGKDDLRMVDPDMIALYSGSGYPVNWGELDPKGFYVVNLKPGETYGALGHIHLAQVVLEGKDQLGDYQRYYFYQPPMKKMIIDWTNDHDFPPDYEILGFQVWIEYRATEEEMPYINTDSILQHILSKGAISGSKVTTSLIHAETVRTSNIQSAGKFSEEVKIYHDNSVDTSIDIESVIRKADDIEARYEKEIGGTRSKSLRLVRARIKGNTGIHKGTGLKEITIDFENFPSGLIALIAKNGTGKTMLMENLQPFPSMITRTKPLQTYFFLKDSARELWYEDYNSGDLYKILINIDGKNKKNSLECGIWKNEVPITNGKKQVGDDCYDRVVKNIFGSFELFKRAVFVSQSNNPKNPSLPHATAGEKKTVFAELAGLGYMQAFSDMAKNEADTITKKIEEQRNEIGYLIDTPNSLEIQREDLTKTITKISGEKILLEAIEIEGKRLASSKKEADEIEQKNQAIEAKIKKITKLTSELEKQNGEIKTFKSNLIKTKQFQCEIDTDLQKLLNKESELKIKNLENQKIEIKIGNLKKNKNEKAISLCDLESEIAELKEILSKKELAEKIIMELEELQLQEKELMQAQFNYSEKKSRIMNKYHEEKKIFDDTMTKKQMEMKSVLNQIEVNKTVLVSLHDKISLIVTCPECKHTFPANPDTEKILKQIENIELKNKQLNERSMEITNEIHKLIIPVEPKVEPFDFPLLKTVQENITQNYTDNIIVESRAILSRAAMAESEIEKKTLQESSIKKDLQDIKSELSLLDKLYDSLITHELKSVENTIKERRQQKSAVEIRIGAMTGTMQNIEKYISEITVELKTYPSKDDLEKEIETEIGMEICILENKIQKNNEDRTNIIAVIAGLEERISGLKESIDKLKVKRKRLLKLKDSIRTLDKEEIEWRYLQKAAGKNGIQALKLDALAPDICHYINRFLIDDPNINRYNLAEIRTVRDAGTGKKKHQVEDFTIWFYDSKHHDWVDYADLSGGESLWSTQAVTDAFSIISKRNTGMSALTCFKDEADGALDPSAKEAYFKMLESAHIESGRFHTVIITHSPAIQEMIPQQIVMNELEETSQVEN